MRKVLCIVNMAALIVSFRGVSVMKVDISGAVNKKIVTSGFGLQVILIEALCVSGPCIFQISCGTGSKLD